MGLPWKRKFYKLVGFVTFPYYINLVILECTISQLRNFCHTSNQYVVKHQGTHSTCNFRCWRKLVQESRTSLTLTNKRMWIGGSPVNRNMSLRSTVYVTTITVVSAHSRNKFSAIRHAARFKNTVLQWASMPPHTET